MLGGRKEHCVCEARQAIEFVEFCDLRELNRDGPDCSRPA